MNRHLAGLGLAALLTGIQTGLAESSTMRCSSQLISLGDRAFEVEQKCGRPVSQSIIGSREGYGNRYYRSEPVLIEEWVYGPDHGMYRYLRFEGSRLTSIQSKRGR